MKLSVRQTAMKSRETPRIIAGSEHREIGTELVLL